MVNSIKAGIETGGSGRGMASEDVHYTEDSSSRKNEPASVSEIEVHGSVGMRKNKAAQDLYLPGLNRDCHRGSCNSSRAVE